MKGSLVAIAVTVCIAVLYFLLMHNRSPSIVKHRFTGYEIWEVENLLTPNECQQIQEYALKKGMLDSYIWSNAATSENIVETNYRNSKQVWMQREELAPVAKLSRFAASVTGLPASHQEDLQVVRYDVGGRFDDHYDVCTSHDPDHCMKMNNGAGERRVTMLVYLNDEYQGGETVFPLVQYAVKPKRGKAVLFWNTDLTDQLLPMSKHRGNPVQGGHKWIATIWSHPKPYVSNRQS